MFKTMLRPGIIAGVIGAILSVLVSVLLTLALLLPGDTGLTVYCLSTPVGFALSLGIGLLAAFLAQRRSPEKLTANKTAPAGVIAGVVSTVLGVIALPVTQQLPAWLGVQGRLVDASLYTARLMGTPPEQLEVARKQIEQQLSQGVQPGQMAIGLVCGLVMGVALGAGGAALGALIWKPTMRRKLNCVKCNAVFELGGNAFIEVKEGSPDLVDYCNWEDLMPEAAKQQRKVIAEVLKPFAEGQIRQWQCGMCKTAQMYPTSQTANVKREA